MKIATKEISVASSSFQIPLFIFLFALVYSAFEFVYFKIPDSFLLDTIYHHGLARPSAAIINLVQYTENVVAVRNLISSPGVSLEIVRGCDGAGTFFLLISAILTFSASLKSKVIGLISGIALLSAINLLRIIALYFVMAYQRQWFSAIHTYFAPSLIIVIGCLFFAAWARYASINKPL